MDDNYTKFPNTLLDSTELDVYEFRLLSIIIRKTIGFNKKSDGISLSQFMKFGRIGKPKVIATLKKLKSKKLITSTKQKTKTGADSFTRYRLSGVSEDYTRVSEDYGEGNREIQGRVSEDYTHEDNNTKENRQNIEREYIGDVFFHLSKKDQVKESERYIENIIDSSDHIKSEKAFSVSIRKKFNKKDKSTLDEFEKWYLTDKSEEIEEVYRGKAMLFNSCSYSVSSVYPYFHTKGYAMDHKIYVALVDGGDTQVVGFNDIPTLEHQLQKGSLS